MALDDSFSQRLKAQSKKRIDELKEMEKASKSTKGSIDALKKTMDELIQQLKEGQSLTGELKNAFRESASSGENIGESLQEFSDSITEAINSISGVAGKGQSADIVFKQQVPLVGLRTKLLVTLGRDIEKVITLFTDDLSTAFSTTVDSFAERFQREMFGDIKVYTEKLKGRQGVRDEIISSLGPLANYANPELVESLYNTKVRLFVDPAAEGADKIAKQLNPKINKFSEDNIKSWWESWSEDTMNAFSAVFSAFTGQGLRSGFGSRKEEKL